ncbi:MAG TPA: YdeI/OmpD-associated family protein [Vicinamibacteria bacterium]|nr:YdeI/OmpD-associated family protein [Vicinamibacteria bacterium]
MRPRAFRSAAAFRAWLEAHHASASELLVRCFKVSARDRGVTYTEALDEALCFGWIDGVRRAVDAHSFSVRFTPRKAKSYWSAVNRRHAERLQADGRMHPAGLAAFRKAAGAGAGAYSFERRPQSLPPAYQKRLRARPRAWAFYQQQPPWYRRTSAFWVISARREETRERRLAELIACSEEQRPIGPLARTKPLPPTRRR